MVSGSSNWTIPNVLTVARILATPLFVTLFLDGGYLAALSIFFLAGITDALDGFLARVLNQRSPLGAVLDPLADKILLDTAFVCLGHEGWISNWLAVAVVSRDVIILGGVALLTFWGRDMRASIRPSLVSKATTLFQMAMVLAAFISGMSGGAGGLALDALAWATAGLTLASGGHYVVKGLALFTNADAPG
ncbi:CDP-alcohol phosphatidyltransferase family protein [Fundidesulfovibrio terrae]|uniref:CDP-alcohol phosphatidyltransferase family protein n=1 Tax=Fundidesulfovibrio terrae TaxID=2922866 RepID=UPI001FAFB8C3|nr:CDP-alcohol phosphatidyltransferase family protein [Fundidesulfovibrio terrae]